MKKIIVKTSTLLIGFGLITYIGRLISWGAEVTGAPGPTNTAALIGCALIALYLVAINFYYQLVPNNRWLLALIGILLLFAADNMLVDDPYHQIYLQDIIKLVAVFLMIAGPTKLFIDKQRAKELEEQGVEVIEV